jgi:hypothetical protein
MPVETIKCQECGSADVTEFKVDTYVCGHCEAVFKHVDPLSVSSCSCGTFAIGRCAICHMPVCAQHSEMLDGQRLCMEHAEGRHAAGRVAAAQRREEAEQTDHARHEQERQAWLVVCHNLLAEIDPVAAHVMAVREATALEGYQPKSEVAEVRSEQLPYHLEGISLNYTLLNRLVPDQSSPDLWDDDAVQAWFHRAVKAPTRKLGYGSKPLFGGRRRLVDGWLLHSGWTKDHDKAFGLVVIVSGGRRLFVERSDVNVLELCDDARLNAYALCQMADMAELPRLPPPPPTHYTGLS